MVYTYIHMRAHARTRTHTHTHTHTHTMEYYSAIKKSENSFSTEHWAELVFRMH